MNLTPELLAQLWPDAPGHRVMNYAPALEGVMLRYGITSAKHPENARRACHFLAQLGHECDQLRGLSEYASGAAYEGNKNLGNTHPGDGVKYKGRGVVQLTGRWNYTAYGKYVNQDFARQPTLLSELPWSADSAGWFWSVLKKLNPLADENKFTSIVKLLNGPALHGHNERLALYEHQFRVLKAHGLQP